MNPLQILFALTCLISSTSLVAYAQDAATSYPNKPVKIISPFAPGGATDILARILAQKLGEAWKLLADSKPWLTFTEDLKKIEELLLEMLK